MKHVIMVNPTSGKKRGHRNALIVQKLLKKYNIEARIIVSKKEGELESKARQLSHRSQYRFYSIGGDGTLNEVISGIVGTDSEVVALPCGTGNDFARHVNEYRSLRKIVLTSINSKSQKYDVIKLDNNRYCINVLNIGFDALVAYNMNKFRWVPFANGAAKYNLAIIYTLFVGKNYNLKVKTSNFEEEKSYTFCAFSNGKYYGGGIIPSPNAVANDGKLSACIVSSTNLFTKLLLLPKYKNTQHMDLNKAHIDDSIYYFIVDSNKKFPLSIDGEIIFTDHIKGTIVPGAINVVPIKKR